MNQLSQWQDFLLPYVGQRVNAKYSNIYRLRQTKQSETNVHIPLHVSWRVCYLPLYFPPNVSDKTSLFITSVVPFYRVWGWGVLVLACWNVFTYQYVLAMPAIPVLSLCPGHWLAGNHQLLTGPACSSKHNLCWLWFRPQALHQAHASGSLFLLRMHSAQSTG